MTSGTSVGTCATVSDAVIVCRPLPAAKFSSRPSSVRACSEFFVVTPFTGAQKTRWPLSSAVSQGGVRVAGFTISASPFDPGTGSVSCHPSSIAATAGGTGPAGAGVDGAGADGPEHDASATSSAAPSTATPARALRRRKDGMRRSWHGPAPTRLCPHVTGPFGVLTQAIPIGTLDQPGRDVVRGAHVAGTVRFQDLGTLVLDRENTPLPVNGTRLVAALALLLVHAGRHVSVDALAEAMWGG